MMFSLIGFFQTINLLQSPCQLEEYGPLENQSFAVHLAVFLGTVAIYCFELFGSFEAFSKYRMTEAERQRVPTSLTEKLEHDENNPDRANYHPAYVMCHLLYYLILSLIMVVSVILPTFLYSLETIMALSTIYFLLIGFWCPYYSCSNIHNHFLKLYYGTFVLFLGFCYLFAKSASLGRWTYVAVMYLILLLIASIAIAGFVRIFWEYRFRKALKENGALMDGDGNKPTSSNKKSEQN